MQRTGNVRVDRQELPRSGERTAADVFDGERRADSKFPPGKRRAVAGQALRSGGPDLTGARSKPERMETSDRGDREQRKSLHGGCGRIAADTARSQLSVISFVH